MFANFCRSRELDNNALADILTEIQTYSSEGMESGLAALSAYTELKQ